jgi:hypothetical protein
LAAGDREGDLVPISFSNSRIGVKLRSLLFQPVPLFSPR